MRISSIRHDLNELKAGFDNIEATIITYLGRVTNHSLTIDQFETKILRELEIYGGRFNSLKLEFDEADERECEQDD